jgi:penicillin-binding protein 1A
MALARSRAARILLALGGLAALGALVGGFLFYTNFLRDLPDLRTLEDYRPWLTSRVLDREGRLIGEFYDERRFLVSLDEIPRHAVMAFVAAEDDTFYEHQGLDYQAILRAAWKNLAAGGEIRQGGSTITQQVAKSLLLSPERRYTRKVKDMLLARRIEQQLTKDEILYLYLNQIYFGRGAYGIGEAARSYFGIVPAELTISQSALLAGLPKAPSAYSPHRNPEAAERRRQYVLRRMYEEGYLNESGYEEAVAAPPGLAEAPEAENLVAAAYFVEEVRRALFESLGGERVRRDGLVVETTLDLDTQLSAVGALRRGLEALDHRQGYRGPLRRVPPKDVGQALAGLAEENGLLAVEGEEAVPLTLPADRPLLGVVTAVDPKSDTAEVAFAPGLTGRVSLKDVNWAREPDPSRYPYSMRNIESIFQVGDVARFDAPASGASDGAVRKDPARLLLHQEPEVEGALFATELETGDVLALVGGYDFERSEFDRVTQARRQPGSAFKPIIYGAAMAHGWTPASIVVDRPLVYEDPESGFTWRPGNYKGVFHGKLTLRQALARSVNNATIHLLNELGVDNAMEFARRVGIESPMDRNLSLALGASSVSLLELVRAYTVFPNEGRLVEPRFVLRVLDRDGNALLENLMLGAAPVPEEEAEPGTQPLVPEASAPPERRRLEADDLFEPPEGRVLSPVHAYLGTDLLRAVVTEKKGTGKTARVLKRTVAGKTGTTNEQGDAWFVGFSPDVASGVWVGFDERRVLGRRETGGGAALPIWIDFMRSALAGRPDRDFAVPEGIVFARVERKTGLPAGPASGDTYFQAFATGTEPGEDEAGRPITAQESDRLLRRDAF